MLAKVMEWLKVLVPVALAALAGYEGHYVYGNETREQAAKTELATQVIDQCTDTVRVETRVEKIYPAEAFTIKRGNAQCLVLLYDDGQRHTVGCK